MPILNLEEKELWHRIQAYSFDEEFSSPKGFITKLCEEQKWKRDFAEEVIQEYKRFVFLCCLLKEGASPSYAVDQVWHLHLTFTKSYWHRFCPQILGKELHHYPSNGQVQEVEKLDAKYQATLRFYHVYFDELPPSHIWPYPALAKSIKGLNRFPVTHALICLGTIAVLPWLWGAPHAFHLTGPEFLLFYFVVASVSLALTYLHRENKELKYKELVKRHLTDKPSLFQVAYHLYDKHHAVQTALLNLMDNGYLVVTRQKTIEIGTHPKKQLEPNLTENPFLRFVSTYPPETVVPYEEAADTWFKKNDFEHVGLAQLTSLLVVNMPWHLIGIVLGLGVIRVFHGLANSKPIDYLLVEIFFTFFAFFLLKAVFRDDKNTLKNILREQFPPQAATVLSQEYVFSGRRALSMLGAGAFIAAVFPRFDGNGNKYSTNCTSGGCSSSSCSGGGGSCGGGCGGCGGGGD